MNLMKVLFLSSRDVRALLAIDECIPAVERAFRLHGEGKTISPAVVGLHVSSGGFHIKGASEQPLPLSRE